jgi:hypothetical protein
MAFRRIALSPAALQWREKRANMKGVLIAAAERGNYPALAETEHRPDCQREAT